MDNTKYIGMDVHKETISIAVLDASGKLVMESVIAFTQRLVPTKESLCALGLFRPSLFALVYGLRLVTILRPISLLHGVVGLGCHRCHSPLASFSCMTKTSRGGLPKFAPGEHMNFDVSPNPQFSIGHLRESLAKLFDVNWLVCR
jgi:hypothetical protein